MNNYGEIVIYQTEDGLSKLEVNLKDETVWLSIDQMAELFQRDKSTISRHISNVFKEGELKREATVANFATVQIEGNRTVKRNIEYYNLDVIISVGYRVKSIRGTQFRIWANSVLKEYIMRRPSCFLNVGKTSEIEFLGILDVRNGNIRAKDTSETCFFEIPMCFRKARRRKVHRKSRLLKSRCVLEKQEGEKHIGNRGY